MISLEELAKHSEKYIVISQDDTEILASAKSLKVLFKKLEKIKDKDTSIMYVPPIDKALTLLCP